MRQLPVELVLEVIDSIVAGPAGRPVAYPADHWRTKLLLAFNTVSRATHVNARRHLYQHCVYLDSQTRLRRLLRTISGPDHSEDDPKPGESQRYVEIRSLITSMYLSPFPGPTIDDLPIARWTFELLSTLRSSLRRLVVDIHFDTLSRWRDHLDVLPTLRAALVQLHRLEEYVSVRDEYNIHVHDLPLHWLHWPNIARLSVFDCNEWTAGVFNHTPIPERMTHIVLVSPLLLSGAFSFPFLSASTLQSLRVLVLSERVHDQFDNYVRYPDDHDPPDTTDGPPVAMIGARLPVECAPPPNTGFYQAYRNWVRTEAIAGSLWSTKGVVLRLRPPTS